MCCSITLTHCISLGMNLLSDFQLLGPVVVSILQEDMSGCPSAVNEIIPALLLKDVVYGAAAYIYYELSNYLSFKDWYVLFMLEILLDQIALTP